jgi:tetratricopeptide (TPR) repeat protein
MLRKRYLWLLPLISSLTLLASAQESGRIIGQIHVVKGDFPVHQVLVELQLRGATINSSYADNQGRFGFYQLESNPYHVIVNDDDYYPIDEIVNLNLEQSQFAMAQIYLRPREKKTDDPLTKQPAGSNPYIVDPDDYNKRFPKKAVKEYDKGKELEAKGDQDSAIQHYQAALKLAPDYYPAHNNLGALYMNKSDFKDAEEQFRASIRLDQNEAQAYFNLSNVLMLTDRLDESQTILSSGLQHRPDSAYGHFLQGCLYTRTGKLPDAENSLQQALQLDAKMPQAYLQLVNVYLKENRRQDAIGKLQAFLKGFPSSPAAPKA